jgi:hypothetical protein
MNVGGVRIKAFVISKYLVALHMHVNLMTCNKNLNQNKFVVCSLDIEKKLVQIRL